MFQPEFPPIIGGGGAYTQNLTRMLSHLGIKVTLLTSGDNDRTYHENQNLTIKRYKSLKTLYYRNEAFPESISIMSTQIRVTNPDLIHSQYTLPALVTQIANLDFCVPHAITHHKTPEFFIPAQAKTAAWQIYDFVNTAPDSNFIIHSKAFLARLYSGPAALNNSNIYFSYPGIDRTKYRVISDQEKLSQFRNRLNISKTDIILLLPCAIRDRKGLEFACSAISGLKHKNIKVVLTDIPDSDQKKEYLKTLQKKLAPHVFTKHARFTDEEMTMIYNIATVTILPSASEGLGLVLLEAMACNCPVIGCRIMGINEIVEDDYNGKLVEYNNIEQMKAAIETLLTNKKLRSKFVRNGRKILSRKFNSSSQAKNHIRFYQNIIQKNHFSVCGIVYRVKNGNLQILTENRTQLRKFARFRNMTLTESICQKIQNNLDLQVRRPDLSLGDFTSPDSGIVRYYAFRLNDAYCLESQPTYPRWNSISEIKARIDNKNDKQAIEALQDRIDSNILTENVIPTPEYRHQSFQ